MTLDQEINPFLNLLSAQDLELLMEEMEEPEEFKALMGMFKINVKIIILTLTISEKKQGSKDQVGQVEILIRKLVDQGEE